MKAFLTIAAIGLAASVVAPASANLFANPGFEDPITADGPPFVGSWEGFASGAPNTGSGNDTTFPLSGAQHANLNILGDDGSFAGVFQDVPVVPGTSVTFSGFHATPFALEIQPEQRIEWVDAGGGVIGATPNALNAPSSLGTYEAWSLTETVPAGAAFARAVYAVQTFGGPLDGPSNSGIIYLDDMSFVPEPGTIALLGLAGLGLLRRR